MLQQQGVWLDDATALERWLARREPGEPVALDTEFERTDTFFPKPGLVQLAASDGAFLVEPSVASGTAAFVDWLARDCNPKLLYAMSEDLDLIRHWLGCEMAGAIDLQIGAALAGFGYAMGYARLVEELLGETLDKSETRSDWLQRPLSARQEQYALDDVRYLHRIHECVVNRLKEKGLDGALAEESEQVALDWQKQSDPAHYFTRLRGGWRLKRHEQAILQRLSYWRELECRRRNRPRHRILSDRGLLELAQAGPTRLNHLAALPEIPPVVVRRYGEQLLAEVRTAGDSPSGYAIPEPLGKEQQSVYREVKSIVAKAAGRHEVPPELLAPRRRLEQWVKEGLKGRSVPESMSQGWRGRLLSPWLSQLEVVFVNGET